MATPDPVTTLPNSIYLTITDDYAASWKTWEGVREFVQNWYDGVLDNYEQVSPPRDSKRILKITASEDKRNFEAKMIHGTTEIVLGHIVYDQENRRLTLVNHNTELQGKVLLLGYTHKSGHHDVIGQFGEGLKIGTLALLRGGHKVLVSTSHNKTWRFSIQPHPEFHEKVLTVTFEDNVPGSSNPSGLPIGEGDTCSHIWPIEEDDWNIWVKRFLFLIPAENSAATELGSLLFDDHLLCQLYVKQIWVQDRTENRDLQVGVNFKELQIDRDRRAILYQSEIDHNVAIMWARALKHKPELANRYFKLLENSDHTADVRLANMYLEDRQVVGLLADEFIRQYGENAIPVPNSSAAERLSYLHKELQEKVVLCNQNLIDILRRSGKIRMAEDVLDNQQRPEANYGRKLFKDIPEEQLVVLTEAENFVKMVDPKFDTSHIDFHDGRDSVVSYYGENNFEIPQWMLSPEYVHQQIACPADTPEACYCAPAYLCERILSSLGPRKNEPGDRKIQEFLLTLALQAKGKRPKQQPRMSSVSDIMRKNEEELHKKIDYLTESLREEQKKHEANLEEMRTKLAGFQSELASEDVRFVERQQDLIERQRQEKESIIKSFEEKVKAHQKKYEELQEDFSEVSSELQSEKRRKVDVESQIKTEKDRHKNELTLMQLESSSHRKRLAHCFNQMSLVRSLTGGISQKTNLLKELVTVQKQYELDDKSEKCLVCMNDQKDCTLIPCNHKACMKCCEELKYCPLCTKQIQDRKKL